jgi:hypothetical protein
VCGVAGIGAFSDVETALAVVLNNIRPAPACNVQCLGGATSFSSVGDLPVDPLLLIVTCYVVTEEQLPSGCVATLGPVAITKLGLSLDRIAFKPGCTVLEATIPSPAWPSNLDRPSVSQPPIGWLAQARPDESIYSQLRPRRNDEVHTHHPDQGRPGSPTTRRSRDFVNVPLPVARRGTFDPGAATFEENRIQCVLDFEPPAPGWDSMTPTMKANYYARFPRKKRPLKIPPAEPTRRTSRHPPTKSKPHSKPRQPRKQARPTRSKPHLKPARPLPELAAQPQASRSFLECFLLFIALFLAATGAAIVPHRREALMPSTVGGGHLLFTPPPCASWNDVVWAVTSTTSTSQLVEPDAGPLPHLSDPPSPEVVAQLVCPAPSSFTNVC